MIKKKKIVMKKFYMNLNEFELSISESVDIKSLYKKYSLKFGKDPIISKNTQTEEKVQNLLNDLRGQGLLDDEVIKPSDLSHKEYIKGYDLGKGFLFVNYRNVKGFTNIFYSDKDNGWSMV